MIKTVFHLLLLASLKLAAAEHVFDFSTSPLNKLPAGFHSTVTGEGGPSEWKIVLDEIPATLSPLNPNVPASNRRPVLAQVSAIDAEERFPLLIYTNDTFGDFSFTTRFKTVSGQREQMAGVAFRILDEKNYYVVRASSKGNSFRFYKFVNG